MDHSFEAELGQAIVASERMRVLLIARLLAVLLVLFLVITTLQPDLLQRTFDGQVRRDYVVGALFLLSAMETGVAWGLGRLLASGDDLPRWMRYGHAFCECTVVTLVLCYDFVMFPGSIAILMPPLFGYFVIIMLSTLRLDFRLSLFTGLVASAEYLVLARAAMAQPLPPGFPPILGAFSPHGGRALILAGTGLIAGLIGRRIRLQVTQMFETQHERQKVLDVFGRHVSPEVVNKLLEQSAEQSSETRHVCVMFLDIRNFTTFSESKSPADVVSFLNQLFGFMIEEVNRHHGIVNKFLGDGFMAVFGAPLTDGRDCRNAVDASLAILARLEAMIAQGSLPPTRVGIGLHAGDALTGTVGSATRKEYTVIGDVVNLASRIESLNKELGSQVLISDAVWREVATDGIPATPRGPMKVKGRVESVEIHQLA